MKPTALKFMSLVCKKLSENSQDTPLLVWNHFCEAQTVTKLHYLLASNFLRARRRHLDRVSCTLLSRCARKCPQKYSFPARLVASAAVKEACCCWLHFECKPDISADVTGIKYYSCDGKSTLVSTISLLWNIHWRGGARSACLRFSDFDAAHSAAVVSPSEE